MTSCKPVIQGVVFDAFGTLLRIGSRKQPYLQLMRLAREEGRPPQADDARTLMTQELGLAGAAERFQISLQTSSLWDQNCSVFQPCSTLCGTCETASPRTRCLLLEFRCRRYKARINDIPACGAPTCLPAEQPRYDRGYVGCRLPRCASLGPSRLPSLPARRADRRCLQRPDQLRPFCRGLNRIALPETSAFKV